MSLNRDGHTINGLLQKKYSAIEAGSCLDGIWPLSLQTLVRFSVILASLAIWTASARAQYTGNVGPTSGKPANTQHLGTAAPSVRAKASDATSGPAVSVNGTCQVGNCTAPATLTAGSSYATPLSVIYTLPNSDQFLIQGTLTGTDTATTVNMGLGRTTVTYYGNAKGGPSSADTITLDILQNFQSSLGSNVPFNEGVYGAFSPGIGPASTASYNGIVAGTALPVLGPFSPGGSNEFSQGISYFPVAGLGNPLLLDMHYVVAFGAGSSVGSFVIFSDAPVSLPLGGALSVNGTCQVGNCTTPDTVDSNGSLPLAFNFVYTFPSSDQYQVQGGWTASDTGGTSFAMGGLQVTATYLGNNSGTSSGPDVISIDMFQNFTVVSSSAEPVNVQASGVFGGPVSPAGTSASFQIFLGGSALPLLGPYTPAAPTFLSPTSSFNFFPVQNPTLVDYRANLTFGAGSKPGAFIVDGIVPVNGQPAISPGGVVPVYSSTNIVQSGEWISINGTNLAPATNVWTGNFPTSLTGVSVTINSKPAYLWYVSPTQINLQVPDDTAAGPVKVTLETPGGTATSTVTLSQYAPSFSLLNSQSPAAIVVTPGAGGNTGQGYDIIAPVGALPYPTRPVKAGETVILYGVGFGPTTSTVHAGQPFSGAANCQVLPEVTIGGVPAKVTFAGIVEAGLYQLNVLVPAAVGSGNQVLVASVEGTTTQQNVLLAIQ